MSQQLIKAVTQSYMRNDIPEFRAGDTVRVHVRIKEGDRERIQVFEGLVIGRRGGGQLIVFGGLGIEIAFSVELALFPDLTVAEKPGGHDLADGFHIGFGQYARIAHTHRTDKSIGFRTVFIGTGTEHFAFRPCLNMDFQPDNCFIGRHNLSPENYKVSLYVYLHINIAFHPHFFKREW